MLLSLSVKARQTAIDKVGWEAIHIFLNNFIEKQAVSMMPVKHVQSRVCHVTVLASAHCS